MKKQNSSKFSFVGLFYFSLLLTLFLPWGKVRAATYNVPANGSLPSVCERATSWGDVINISSGSYYDGGTCNLRPGVKIAGAGKESTTINTSVQAQSSLPVINGSNEISGIRFDGAKITSSGRSNQKIHDNTIVNAGYDGILIEGKRPGNFEWAGDMCNGRIPAESAMYCESNPQWDHYPEESDWADGVEVYNNDLTDTNLKLYVIRGAKIHNNHIDNSRTGVSGVGHTSMFWNAVDFYNNTIIMDEISWSHIAVEVWKIQNNTKFRDNWTNGWFSLLENAKGINTPYSWQITGNTFSSNVGYGDGRVREALETSYSSSNVLVANNYFENTGANKTYQWGIAIWGNGQVKNYTVRNNVFRNLDGDGIIIQTNDHTKSFGFEGENFKINNNVFDNLRGNGVFIRGDNGGPLTGVEVKNNSLSKCNYGVLVGYSGHNVRNINFSFNNLSEMQYGDGGTEVLDYLPGRAAFSNVSNNFNYLAGFTATGSIPQQYYSLLSNSNLIDKGTNVGESYNGSAPDIGAYEYGGATPPPPSCNNLTFAGGSAIPSSVDENGTYTVGCDYGSFGIDSIKVSNDLGPCEWTHWAGNAAQFVCNAGSAGVRTNTCSTISGTSANSCSQTNAINNVIIVAPVKKYTITDFMVLAVDWLKSVSNHPQDLNNDGKINIRDMGIMMSNWN